MKTISERKRELEEAEALERKRASAADRAKIDAIIRRGIVKHSSVLNIDWLDDFRDNIADGKERGHWAGVACDHCKTELWRGSDMNFCLGAEYKHTCPGCGWITYAGSL